MNTKIALCISFACNIITFACLLIVVNPPGPFRMDTWPLGSDNGLPGFYLEDRSRIDTAVLSYFVNDCQRLRVHETHNHGQNIVGSGLHDAGGIC